MPKHLVPLLALLMILFSFYDGNLQLQAQISGSDTIAFVSNLDGDSEIYLIQSDGNNLRQLTDNTRLDSDPSWSPNGQRIVFSSDRDGNMEIYSMNADGDDINRLTDSPGADYMPRWSPDGEQIVFVSERDGNPELYLMDANGGGLLRLTINSDVDLRPHWSQDGDTVLFDSDRDGDHDIFLIDLVTYIETQLTFNDWEDRAEDWSPDGESILFSSNEVDNFDIYSMDNDGSNITRITSSTLDEFYASYDPTGQAIAVTVVADDDNWDIHIYDLRGNELLILTEYVVLESAPDWQPDVRVSTVAAPPPPPPPPSEPCTVSTSDPYVQVRTGPGEDRTAVNNLPINTVISVIGQDETGLWLLLVQVEASPGRQNLQSWVLRDSVTTSGDCDLNSADFAVVPTAIPIPGVVTQSADDSGTSPSGPDVQATLTWFGAQDLDLIVVEPDGTFIYYGEPISPTGGQLNLDANFPCGAGGSAVENIFWPAGSAPSGTYEIWVQEYDLCGESSSANWTLIVQVNGVVVINQQGIGDSFLFTFNR